MDRDKIKSLIDAMAASDLAEMEFSEGGWSLRLVRHGRSPASAPPVPASTTAKPVRRSAAGRPASEPVREAGVSSPIFGVVYLRPSPDAPDFVSVGDHVKAGATLCVVEAMKVFNEVRADRDGSIAEILVGSGDEVETGQTLMRFA